MSPAPTKATVTPPDSAVAGAPFEVRYTAPARYDNLFIEVTNGTDVSIFRQVRYGNWNLESDMFTVPKAGSYTANLRQPKYANGHNLWPILDAADFNVTA